MLELRKGGEVGAARSKSVGSVPCVADLVYELALNKKVSELVQ